MEATLTNPLNGVRGWLLLLCVGLTIFGPMSAGPEVNASFAAAETMTSGYLQLGFRIEGVAVLLLCGYSFYAGIGLWRLHSGSVKHAKMFFRAGICNSVFSTALLCSSGQPIDLAHVIATSVASVLTCALWLTYLNQSKRVRETYKP